MHVTARLVRPADQDLERLADSYTPAGYARGYWPRKDLFNHRQDKIILYCRTREEVGQLTDLLGCPSYTSKSGSEKEKKAIIAQWLSTINQPAIAATSALCPGFDHPHVRWVIHVNALSQMSDFSQESGRASRDGTKACSVILLSVTWKPQLDKQLPPDQEAMCLRATSGTSRAWPAAASIAGSKAVNSITLFRSACSQRFSWIRAKNEAYQARKKEKKDWIERRPGALGDGVPVP
ncbi:uncharacterized protein PAC_14598 [Phialocephala subalpina]|uniref:DNA 3'-5' helicase n=1 Tax=Phialocephala subalpina TaxID=576137 RepID=A0A1L7XI26_9HELO|nr:uncharacterized protein PAC_14598 [Phialocephala subalpina]